MVRRLRFVQYIRALPARASALIPMPLLVATVLVPALAGCSMSVPMAALKESDETIVTGSIAPARPAALLSSQLSDEDWRRAQAALGVAVDPQGNGAPVSWDNPETGRKGSFTAAGPLYVTDNRICRSFIATIDHRGADQQLHGSTCRNGPNEWVVREARPWKG